MNLDSSKSPFYLFMGKERYELFKSQDLEDGLFDVTFIVDGKEIYAHRFILGSVSTVFKAMFSRRWDTDSKKPIEIDDCSYQTFYDFLSYLYSGISQGLNDTSFFRLAQLSDYYDVTILQNECRDYLSNAKYDTNKFIEFSYQFFDHPTFRDAFRAGLMKQYPKWLKPSQFMMAQKELVGAIFESDRPYKHEAKLFETVYEWAKCRAEYIQRVGCAVATSEKSDDTVQQGLCDVNDMNCDNDCMIIDEIPPSNQPSPPVYEAPHDDTLEDGEIIDDESGDNMEVVHSEEEEDDDCIIIDAPCTTSSTTSKQPLKPIPCPPPPKQPTLNELIKNEMSEFLPYFRFNAMEGEFIDTFIVRRGLGYLFPFTQLNRILCNVKKFNVEITDMTGKKAFGVLQDQNFVVDEISKLKNVRSRGSVWDLSPSFLKSNKFKFVNAGKGYEYYLQILRNNGNLGIAKQLDQDYFLANITAENGFKCNNCIIEIV